MKKKMCLLMLMLIGCFVQAQTNLVPNPDFENVIHCPSTNANITDCMDWMNFGQSPDFYHGCATFPGLQVPTCQLGYQFAHSGVGMPGIITWVNPTNDPANINYREFIGAQLTTILTIGQKYYMSFYINYSGYLHGWRQVATNKLGLKFSTVPSNSITGMPVNNMAHLYTNVLYQDTVNWLKISGSFICDSSYKYVILGNFYDDNNTDTISYHGPTFGGMGGGIIILTMCVSVQILYILIPGPESKIPLRTLNYRFLLILLRTAFF